MTTKTSYLMAQPHKNYKATKPIKTHVADAKVKPVGTTDPEVRIAKGIWIK